MVRNLANRINKLVSPEYKLEDEEETLLKNGYPKVFIEAQFRFATNGHTTQEDDTKKIVMLKMQFRGDAAAELFRRKIERSMKVNCKNIRLITIFTSRPLISTQVKDRISVLATPNVVYRFKCGMCHSTYIGYK